jgi:oxygen-dependent protoporphyrinogen oxidase
MTVGVVGAGITGLVLTHELVDRGVDVVTFEAREDPGGVVWSDRVDGHVLEYGPQRVRLVPAIEDLVEDLGLREELVVADDTLPLYVYAHGRLREVPRSLSALFRSDLLSWRGKARLLAEPLTAPARPDERAADVFTRKFGAETYRNVVEPLFGGIYGSDPAAMPAEHSLSRLMALEERHGSLLRAALARVRDSSDRPAPVSFRDGLQTLPEALYAAHADRIHLDTPVERVTLADDGDGYDVVASGPGGEVADRTVVDELVVTVPAPAAADLLADVPGATVQSLSRLAYNPLVLVHLQADADAEGFGYQIRRDEPFETLGVTWNASLFDREGVYTAFLGGMDAPDVLDRSEDDLARLASEEFTAVMDAPATVLSVRKLPRAFPAHDTSWSALADVTLPDDVHLATNYTGGIGVPSRVREARALADRLAA